MDVLIRPIVEVSSHAINKKLKAITQNTSETNVFRHTSDLMYVIEKYKNNLTITKLAHKQQENSFF